MREICFTYEQGRSAASSGSLPNQAVKHRRTVFEPERGEAGDQLEETEWGGWSFTPCPGTIGASCMGAARNALGTAQQSSLSGPLASTNLLQGWSPDQLLVQDIDLPDISTVASMFPSITYQTRISRSLIWLDSARGHRFPTSGLHYKAHHSYLSKDSTTLPPFTGRV